MRFAYNDQKIKLAFQQGELPSALAKGVSISASPAGLILVPDPEGPKGWKSGKDHLFAVQRFDGKDTLPPSIEPRDIVLIDQGGQGKAWFAPFEVVEVDDNTLEALTETDSIVGIFDEIKFAVGIVNDLKRAHPDVLLKTKDDGTLQVLFEIS
jgi:hypothetical protein